MTKMSAGASPPALAVDTSGTAWRQSILGLCEGGWVFAYSAPAEYITSICMAKAGLDLAGIKCSVGQ